MSKAIIKPKMTFGNELRFTPYAWSKLLFMRDRGNTEVAGYCITGTEDPLLVTDFKLIKQDCTGATFDLDPDDGAEFVESMLDTGLMPWQYSNILAHTHPPGCGPSPSGTDENNFKSAFSHPDWAIMLIIGDENETYCRLKINIGPGTTKQLKTSIDWGIPFSGSNSQAWDTEYRTKVTQEHWITPIKTQCNADWPFSTYAPYNDEWPDVDEIEELDCHWDYQGNVVYFNHTDSTWYVYNPVEQKWYIEASFDYEESMVAIQTPNEPWVAKVIAWAERYSNGRELALNSGNG